MEEAEALLRRSHRESGKQLGEQHPTTLSLGIWLDLLGGLDVFFFQILGWRCCLSRILLRCF